jgi:hypothetical protein
MQQQQQQPPPRQWSAGHTSSAPATPLHKLPAQHQALTRDCPPVAALVVRQQVLGKLLGATVADLGAQASVVMLWWC